MKFKLIALAAMLAATGAAHAKIADSNDRAPNGGDLFANVWSVSQNASFTVDLGMTLDQWAAGNMNADGIKLVWDFRNGTFTDMSATASGIAMTQTIDYGGVWDIFATPAVGGAADLKFDIKAMDGTPTAFPGAGTNRYLSSSFAGSITATNGQVFSMDNWDVIVNASNNDATNSTHGADLNVAGANMFDGGDAMNVNYSAGGEQWNGATSFNSAGSVNGALNFYFLTNGNATAAQQASVSKYLGQWTFDATTAQLTYATAPVPEAETYAMMLAGLGLVGFMAARRRNRI
ncbi:MAG: hypothetical protein ABS91_00500 [Thiobacillus sp. SCN 64-35]|nr:MAG: hypothetical protein ABS91_00500 [Thiobacillus sp. SCN 64-35]ODU88151.1 MAG: hypothetical protein ABT21_12240 [Thiobacillus sp. SCN 65-179]OJW36399.1 MAG: hypothetical protein BGO61_01595 [Thiobacillus sp. 65-69]